MGEVKLDEATIWLHPTPDLYESRFVGASLVKPFRFTPFSRKQLQMGPEAGEKAMPNRAKTKG
jgi:hypothetical protein